LSRVSRRRLRRWRRGRWREVGGQQGRGHQPDRGQGGQRQPIGASRGRGQASDQDGPADRGAQAGAEFGHAARQARDLALRLTSWRARTSPQLAQPYYPAVLVGLGRGGDPSQGRADPRITHGDRPRRRFTGPRPRGASVDGLLRHHTPPELQESRGGSGRAGPASRLCPGAGSRVGEYVRTGGAVFAVQACQQSPRGRNRPTSPRRRLYGPGSEWHGRGGRPRLRPDGDGTSRGNG
jgi:hypothetical protein